MATGPPKIAMVAACIHYENNRTLIYDQIRVSHPAHEGCMACWPNSHPIKNGAQLRIPLIINLGGSGRTNWFSDHACYVIEVSDL